MFDLCREELLKKVLAAGKGGEALGLERISQLETHLVNVSSTCSQQQEHISELKTQNSSLKNELHRSLAVEYVYCTSYIQWNLFLMDYRTPL